MLDRDEREELLRRLPNKQRAAYHCCALSMDEATADWMAGDVSEGQHAIWINLLRDLVGAKTMPPVEHHFVNKSEATIQAMERGE